MANEAAPVQTGPVVLLVGTKKGDFFLRAAPDDEVQILQALSGG